MFVAVLCCLAVAPAALAVTLTSSEAAVLRAMNDARRAQGLGGLRIDAALERAARSHSQDMLRNNYFAHGAFAQRIQSFHAQGPVFGENLAWGSGPYAAAQSIVGSWLASPGHRANLLRPGFRRVGVGAAAGTFSGYHGALVVTADFAGR